MEIIREEGVAGLWTGLKASLVLTVVSVHSIRSAALHKAEETNLSV